MINRNEGADRAHQDTEQKQQEELAAWRELETLYKNGSLLSLQGSLPPVFGPAGFVRVEFPEHVGGSATITVVEQNAQGFVLTDKQFQIHSPAHFVNMGFHLVVDHPPIHGLGNETKVS
jgi:hypothetical protein